MPQGTYCILLDCSEWCESHQKSIEELAESGVEVGVLWREGTIYHVPHGIRMNLALPHHKVVEAFERLEKYVF
jgi:cystathionine beta-lyase